MIMLLFSACSNDTYHKSKVEGISDEVYEQLVQFYFYTVTIMEVVTDKNVREGKSDKSWIKEHELYEEAEKYAEENDTYDMQVFPNSVILEYLTKPETFSEIEQKYLEKMLRFMKLLIGYIWMIMKR